MSIKITPEVETMLKTEEGRQKLIALKLCEISEQIKEEKRQPRQRSIWEEIFGHRGNE